VRPGPMREGSLIPGLIRPQEVPISEKYSYIPSGTQEYEKIHVCAGLNHALRNLDLT
jgi:hypothetical protein